MTETEKSKNDANPTNTAIKQYLPTVTVILIILIVVVSIFGIANTLFSANNGVESDDLSLTLKPMGNLTTVEVKAAKIGVQVKANVRLCSFGAEYLVNGTVEAGVNLTDFSPANISFDDNTKAYTITLPEPTITRCEFTHKRYFDWTSICAGIDKATLDRVAAYETSKGIIQDVQARGIVEQSKRETSDLMSNIVKTLTGHFANIEFITPEIESQLPPSCDPEPPSGWTQDDNGTWFAN